MADTNGNDDSELQRLNDYLCNLNLSGSGEEALEDYLLRRTAAELLAAASPGRAPAKPPHHRDTGHGLTPQR